jgi:hypothetical protein
VIQYLEKHIELSLVMINSEEGVHLLLPVDSNKDCVTSTISSTPAFQGREAGRDNNPSAEMGTTLEELVQVTK